MNKELKQWAWDMQRTIDSAVERINNNTLSDKDAAETATMLLQLDHEVRNDPEYHTDTTIPAISVALNELYDALNTRNVKLLQLDNDVFRQLLSFGEVLITKEEREAYENSGPIGREDGRTYIDFLPKMPHEQYLQLVENLKELGAKYDPEIKQWYVDKDWEPKKEQGKLPQGNKDAEKTESPDIDEDRRFKAVYYNNSERKEIFSSSKADAIDTVRRHIAPAPVNRFLEEKVLTGKERCYIQEYDADAQKYQQEGIYLIASGRDVTPVAIHLPPYMSQETFGEVREEMKKMGVKFDAEKKIWYVERGDESVKMDDLQKYLNSHDEATYLQLPQQTSPEKFKEIIEQLKQDGARYNPDKKAWYITDKNDISKFAQYLPSGAVQAESGHNNPRKDEVIYLHLPQRMTSEQFKQMITQLKQDGARYNPDKKAWYITSKNDISKFTPYLPPDSVHAKLEQNKKTVSTAENAERSIEPRKKEEHIV